jgi:hypothetical protein
LERALGNNSSLIQWRKEEWGWGKEAGKYRKEEKNKMSMVCQMQSMQTDMDSSAYIHFIQKVQITHEKIV